MLCVCIVLPKLIKAVIQKGEHVAFEGGFVVPFSVQSNGELCGIAVEGLKIQPAFSRDLVTVAIFCNAEVVAVFVFVEAKLDLSFFTFLQLIHHRLQKTDGLSVHLVEIGSFLMAYPFHPPGVVEIGGIGGEQEDLDRAVAVLKAF